MCVSVSMSERMRVCFHNINIHRYVCTMCNKEMMPYKNKTIYTQWTSTVTVLINVHPHMEQQRRNGSVSKNNTFGLIGINEIPTRMQCGHQN